VKRETPLRQLIALVSGCFLLATPAAASNRNAEGDGDDDGGQPVCLGLSEDGAALFKMTIVRRSMIDPREDDIRLVRSLLNETDPAIGVAVRSGRETVLMNLSGTVAGFFVAMQIRWNPRLRTGSGRMVGELTAHPRLQVSEVPCG
jgi:hypothetical protein